MNFKKIINPVIPPPQWRVAVIIALGVFMGLVLVILHISNATSYLSNDPRACINCHVMATEYASWQKSSHARVATCNDCHVPHGNFISTYSFKASDGLRHATMFTFRLEPQVIHIKEAGASVVQENCIRCHEALIDQAYIVKHINLKERDNGVGKFCWDCHRETPHGSVRGLSAYPFARIPQLEPVIPEWLDKLTSTNDQK